MDAVGELKAIAAECGASPDHLALEWLLSESTVSSVIAGAKNADQVSDNVFADSIEISAEQLAAIDALTMARTS